MKKSADQSRSIYCNFGTECDSCCIGRLQDAECTKLKNEKKFQKVLTARLESGILTKLSQGIVHSE